MKVNGWVTNGQMYLTEHYIRSTLNPRCNAQQDQDYSVEEQQEQKHWGEPGFCEHCGGDKYVELLEDPYLSELDGSTGDFSYWCKSCYENRHAQV